MSVNQIKKSSTSTIAESAYYALRKNIMDLNLKPGSEINIKDLVEALQVSRSPVRDAILQLGKEGLVQTLPQRGTFVSKIDLKRVQEEKFIRESLEEKVLLICKEKIAKADLLALNNNIMNQEKALLAEEYREYFTLDDAFHEMFFRIAGQELSWELIQSMSGHYYRIRFLSLSEEKIAANILKEHRQLVEYLGKREEKGIVETIHEHCSKLNTEESILCERFPTYFIAEKENQTMQDNFLRRDFLQSMD